MKKFSQRTSSIRAATIAIFGMLINTLQTNLQPAFRYVILFCNNDGSLFAFTEVIQTNQRLPFNLIA